MDILCGCRGQVGRLVAIVSEDGKEIQIKCKHKTFVTCRVINGKIMQVFDVAEMPIPERRCR